MVTGIFDDLELRRIINCVVGIIEGKMTIPAEPEWLLTKVSDNAWKIIAILRGRCKKDLRNAVLQESE
jgi:hypothetical protein